MASRKIEPTDGLELFVNQHGSITISQYDPIEQAESLVVIQLRDVAIVRRWLAELLVEAKGEN